jgi:hypothetical protein
MSDDPRSTIAPFRSNHEKRVAEILRSLSIYYEYEPISYQLPNGERYIPDFWLPELRTFIEVKGHYAPRLHKPALLARFFRDAGHRVTPDGSPIAPMIWIWYPLRDPMKDRGPLVHWWNRKGQECADGQFVECALCELWYLTSRCGPNRCTRCGWDNGPHEWVTT